MSASHDESLARLQKRLERERSARKTAEQILSDKSRQLFSEHEKTENAKSLLEMALWASGESIWSWHKSTDTFFFKQFQDSDTDVVEYEVSFDDFIAAMHPADVDDFLQSWQHNKIGLEPTIDHLFRIQQNGKYVWIRNRGRVVAFDDDAAQSIVGTSKDVTDLKESEVSFKLMSYAFSHSREPMLILTKSLQVIEANNAFLDLLNLSPIDIVDRSLSEFVELSRKNVEVLSRLSSLRTESKLTLDDNRRLPIEVSMSEFRDTAGNKEYIIATLRDLTEQKISERKLYKLAHYDPLTNLLNRPALQEQLDDLIKDPKQDKVAVYFVDLDGFKSVNDTLGHESGDALLKTLADALTETLSPFTILSRWGGDEFIVVYPYKSQDDWERKAQRIIDCITTQAVMINHQRVDISASVGVSLYPEHGGDVDSLLRNADAAMYKAKGHGKNQWLLYYKGLTDEAIKRVTLLSELRKALENEGLDFVLQGKYDEHHNLIGAEVLCRWQSALYGPISPAVFVPIIESNGLENQLGILALKAAANFIRTLDKYGIEVPISVNISSPQILDPQFKDDLMRICDEYHVAHQLIEIEITESVFMSEDAKPSDLLQPIQDLGFRIALDDFGTGYSSLSYLRQFKFDVVKIDRSFILDLENNERAYSLFIAIIEMCNALQTETIVEGIETELQFNLLNDAGVRKYQGFLFGKPISIAEFVKNNVV